MSKTITIKAINKHYYDIEFDFEDIYNHNMSEKQFITLDMENVARVMLDDSAVHIEMNGFSKGCHFTIDLDKATMSRAEDWDWFDSSPGKINK